uniref:Secreted protein n=1 Tax=Parascaris univalens TaxID=6257 RepID=A0A915CBE6_PARUN
VYAQRRRPMFGWPFKLFVTTTVATINSQLILPKVRSLSGSQATTGNNATNADVLKLITVGLLGSFAPRRVKQYNDRIYLSRYRRSYWLGARYFHLDNKYYLPTRETCIYHMNETERRDLEYEDGVPIDDIIYQCQRYVQYCCGLDCCVAEGVNERNDWYAPPQYPWEYPSSVAPVDTFVGNKIYSILCSIFLLHIC